MPDNAAHRHDLTPLAIALRLAKVLGTTPELWFNLQTDYDLQTTTRSLVKELAKIEQVREVAQSNAQITPSPTSRLTHRSRSLCDLLAVYVLCRAARSGAHR